MADLLLVALFLLVSGILAGAETGAYRVNRIRLHFRALQDRPRAVSLARLLHDRQRFVAMILGGTNLAQMGASSAATAFFMTLGATHPEFIATLCLTPLVLIVSEILPKAFFAAHANTVMYWLTVPLRLANAVLWPLTQLLRGVLRVASAILGQEDTEGLGRMTAARLRYFFQEGRLEGTITPQQGAMAHNIIDLRRTRVSNVVIPVEEVLMVPRDVTAKEARDIAERTAHSRLPVYDGARTNIVGILVLLAYLMVAEPDTPPAEHLREPVRLEPNLSIDEALRRLRRAKQPMGIVTNAQGIAIGIVTIKDLVQEIVGELKEW